jgi:hypothetical protein
MFNFQPTIDVGNLLTSFSVVIALAGFLYTWAKDRKLRTKEYADRVRSAAALTLSKIDRCESLFLSFFHLLQPLITEADELIVKDKDEIKCRDLFWKQVTNARLVILTKFSNEEIELAYAPLLPFRNDIYAIFRSAINDALRTEDSFFWPYLDECQKAILGVKKSEMKSAVLGNILREILGNHESMYSQQLAGVLKSVRQFLHSIVASDDKEVVSQQLS